MSQRLQREFGIDYVLAHELHSFEKKKQFPILIFPSYIFPSNFSEKGSLESTMSLPLNADLSELRTALKGLWMQFFQNSLMSLPFNSVVLEMIYLPLNAVRLESPPLLFLVFEWGKGYRGSWQSTKSPRMYSVIFSFSSFFFPLLPGLIVGKEKTMSSPITHFFRWWLLSFFLCPSLSCFSFPRLKWSKYNYFHDFATEIVPFFLFFWIFGFSPVFSKEHSPSSTKNKNIHLCNVNF